MLGLEGNMKFIWGLPCILPLGKCRKGKSEVQGCEKKKSQLFDSSLHQKIQVLQSHHDKNHSQSPEAVFSPDSLLGGGIDYSVASSSA